MGFLIVLAMLVGASAVEPATTPSLHQEARRQTQAIRNGGADWPVLDTRHFRIHHQPGQHPDPQAVSQLDSFTENVWQSLADPDQGAVLGGRPVDYYLCDDATVQRLTGYPTKGMADLAGRAIISSHFPHFHELVHLLVHELAEDPPEQTLLVLQEGTACLLGGRWGRSTSAVLYTGWVHGNMSGMHLEQALTQDGFRAYPGGPDASYPLATLICRLVRQKTGWPGLLELTDRLSGSLEYVQALGPEDFYRALEKVCDLAAGSGAAWLEERLDQAWPALRRCGIAPVGEWPGQAVFTVAAETFPVYRLSREQPRDNAASSLFAEHFPGRPYRGQHFGMRISPEEVALYDYHANQLVAIWVGGFTDEWGALGSGSSLRFAAAADLVAVVQEVLHETRP